MKIEFIGSISDSTSAIKRSGKLPGGGAITFDVPETYVKTLAALMPLVLMPLRVTIEVATDVAIEPASTNRGRGKRKVEAVSEEVPTSTLLKDEEEANARRLLDEFRAQSVGTKPPPRPEWNP